MFDEAQTVSQGTTASGSAAVRAPTRRPPSARDSASMLLVSVRDHGRIVDFRWEYANALAARLMQTHPLKLIGKGLREVVGPLGHPALIDRYRRVVENGNAQSFEQVHSVGGGQDLVLHRVVRSGDGVVVSLVNLSAQRRRLMMQLQTPNQPTRLTAHPHPTLQGNIR